MKVPLMKLFVSQIYSPVKIIIKILSDQSRCGAWFVFPCWWKDALCFVEASQSVDSWFNKNQTEFAVLVLAIAFQMLADGNGFFDQIVQILWDVWFQTQRFHDPQDLVTGNETDLGNTMRITKDDTCLMGVRQEERMKIIRNQHWIGFRRQSAGCLLPSYRN